MACMEHECYVCGWFQSDNKSRKEEPCPRCGSYQVGHFFDEQYDHYNCLDQPADYEEEGGYDYETAC